MRLSPFPDGSYFGVLARVAVFLVVCAASLGGDDDSEGGTWVSAMRPREW